MSNLSPAARAIVGVFDVEYYQKAKNRHDALASVLRAAADCLNDATSAHTLYAISDELGGVAMTDFRPTTLSPEALKAWDAAEANIEASVQRIKELTNRSDPEEKTTLTVAQLKECMSAFYEWFCEPEGFSYREERFWDACERKDDKELLTWLKTAWHMGYEQCFLEKVNEPI